VYLGFAKKDMLLVAYLESGREVKSEVLFALLYMRGTRVEGLPPCSIYVSGTWLE
jgi:hypothetical protein